MPWPTVSRPAPTSFDAVAMGTVWPQSTLFAQVRTVPVVREVGGLADTVTQYAARNGGTGFLFKEYTADAMLEAVQQAVALFARKREWSQLRRMGMAKDFSWASSLESTPIFFSR